MASKPPREVVRQRRRGLRAARSGVDRGDPLVRRRHKGPQPLCAVDVLGDDSRLPHSLVPVQNGCDLPGLNPVAIDLDLAVSPPVEVDDAVGAVAADVSGVVEATILPGGEAELLRRRLRVPAVLRGQAVTGDVDEASDTIGALIEELVQHLHPLT